MISNLLRSVFLLIIMVHLPFGNYANSEYQELIMPKGKVISGLSAEEVLREYGYPSAIDNDLWQYSNPEGLFVYLPDNLTVHLYPEFCNSSVGLPLELKAFAAQPELQATDVTSTAEFIISEPDKFTVINPGVLIPKEAGRYQVLAKYKGSYSNPVSLVIKQQADSRNEKETLLRIDILPYKPKISPPGGINFLAYGTFIDSLGRFIIKDLYHNVTWFRQGDADTIRSDNSNLEFREAGKFKVFCSYGELTSLSQEVEVSRDLFSNPGHTLSNITLLPEFISTNYAEPIVIKAFGTYEDNIVEDISGKVKWEVKDREVLDLQGGNSFWTKSEGITEVKAGLGNVESLPVKIIVTKKSDHPALNLIQEQKGRREQEDFKANTLLNNIKNNIERIADNIPKKERELHRIKIAPEHLEIGLGESGQFSASGKFSDNTEEDLTLVGNWKSSAERVAFVSLGGRLVPLSTGEAKIKLEYKGIESGPASVVVKEPRLISIIATPENVQLAMNKKAAIKAEGYYTDNSRSDITSLVSWRSADPKVAGIKNNYLLPRFFGKTQVFAEYLSLRSMPINVTVVITPDWVVWIALRIIFVVILMLIAGLIVLYFKTLSKAGDLAALQIADPRRFIVEIYKNMKDVLSLCGQYSDRFMPPREYCHSVEKRYSIEDSLFFNFTREFEEAGYSRHDLRPAEAKNALDNYNNFLKIALGRQGKFAIILIYLRSLIRRVPIFVIKAAE